MAVFGVLKELLQSGLRKDIGQQLDTNDIVAVLEMVQSVAGSVVARLAEFQSRQSRLTDYLEHLDRLIVTNIRTPDDLPLPPLKLINLVAGAHDPDWFFEGGKAGADNIREVLHGNHVAIERFRRMLDFGCGCGRVTRWWKGLSDVQVFGTDYNSELVNWCRANLPFAKFSDNNLEPPARLESGTFDFIYALSVFTHMPEDLQMRWMGEFSRLLVPEGHLLLTTHGDYYLNHLSEDERRTFGENQLVVRGSTLAGSNDCATYHPEQYVRRHLATGFDVIDFIPTGAKGNPYQDLYLLRKSVHTPP